MNPWDDFKPRKTNKDKLLADLESVSRPHNDEVHNLPGRYAYICDMGEAAMFIKVSKLLSIMKKHGKFTARTNNGCAIGIVLSEGLSFFASMEDGWWVRVTAPVEEGHPATADLKLSVKDEEYEEGLVLNVHVDDAGMFLTVLDVLDQPLHVFEWE